MRPHGNNSRARISSRNPIQKKCSLLAAPAPGPPVTVKGKQVIEGGVVTCRGHLGSGVPADPSQPNGSSRTNSIKSKMLEYGPAPLVVSGER